ncbi:hypothetical protein [Exiguobacterium sp. s154]|uniref:hypothetical protein n=1 Tax=Exiguobacterium sp. s154 TaxID=2751277 RepID=UPI001BEBCDCD|nr:hypothetical protein [Exiguobacterium sp. s154]
MKKQYVQMLVVLVFVISISVIVVLNLTKSVSLVLEPNTEITTNEEQSNAQTTSSDEIEPIDNQSDVTTMDEESLRTFAQVLGVSLKDIVSIDFSTGKYSWANGYDESMVSYYEMMVKTNLYKETELIDYINAIARANYRMEKFRIKVLEEKGYNLVKWDENQDTFQYLSDYSRYSVAELYYKEFPDKRVDDQDSYYLNNALK